MRKIKRSLLAVICMIIMLAADIMPVFAETSVFGQTAAKTVDVSSSDEENAGDAAEEAEENEKAEETEETEPDILEDALKVPVIEHVDVSEMTEIRIGTYEQWCDFAKKCTLDSWSQDKFVVLTDNIEFSMKKYVPVPYFAGVFEGNGHTLNKVAYTGNESFIGLFSKTAPSAVIRNLNAIGVMKPVGSPYNVGGIVGDNYGLIAGCKYDGYVDGNDYIGGIAGYNEASGRITDCYARGKITGLHHVGGIAGFSAGLIKNCTTDADVNTVTKEVETGLSDIKVEELFTSLINMGREEGNKKSISQSTVPVDIGGIVGYNTGEIGSCVNLSAVGYEHVGYNVGGIAGRQSGYIHDCENKGLLHGRKDVGGIVGQAEPYIRLDLTKDVIAQLSDCISKLHDNVDRTIRDTDASSDVVSARLNVIKGFADKALNDTGYLADSTTDFVNGVVGSTNEIIGRIEGVIDDVAAEGGPLDNINSAGKELHRAAYDIGEVAEDLDIYQYMTDEEKANYDNAKVSFKSATEEYSGDFDSKYDEAYPDYYDRFYYQHLKGDINPPDHRPTADEIAAAEAGKTDDEKNAAKAEAAAGATIDAGDDARTYASGRYAANHDGHSYLDDMENYTDTIATTILDNTGEMGETVKDDGMGVVYDVRKMAKDLRDAGKQVKDIVKDVADKNAVQFPQLSDDYKLHTNSLIANIQGMSDNMGFLNNEMRGSTDTVCKDLQGVNDQFSALMLLFTDAVDGALDMDYSDIFEDVSNDVCETSIDATVADCVNNGKVYADINTGGIAGTMAEEYDFDPEGDITGIKDAAKGSTYRTKCVLRSDINRGEVCGKKSYVGGGCGLHEIGTILHCINYGKTYSESGDYVGGIAGMSYSTIRNSYEKGLLSGESYVGGIAGSGSEIRGCFAMPTVLSSKNFAGAVEGFADDETKISDNQFVSDNLAGVDRVSLKGRAEPITYNEMVSREDVPSDFAKLTVRFMVDDKIVASVDKQPGETIKVEDIPVEEDIVTKGATVGSTEDGKVMLEEDQYISWDRMLSEFAVKEDMEITGDILRYALTLASDQVGENKQSLFLVDGYFFKTERLVVTPVPVKEQNISEYIISFPDDTTGNNLIRYKTPADAESVRIYADYGEGFKEVECKPYGAYTTFNSEGHDFTVKIVKKPKEDYTKWLILGGSVIGGIILFIILIKVIGAIKRRKKAKVHVTEAEAFSDVEDISDDTSTDLETEKQD
ncbi:MAG: hypothetical protein K6E49_05615 [Lachnospiraceae bacterium]|nr:hypothetical protein [Lachnospiraceae bacterium]